MNKKIDIIDKIVTVSKLLPELPPKRKKNFFDILGVRNKETINSRVVAYFLNRQEEHGFQSLFFDSLIEILKVKLNHKPEEYFDIFSGNYIVTTEDSTTQAEEEFNKKIDLTISGDNWVIIIENKLYHSLNNPLLAYWQHAKASSKNVIGVVLSLGEKNKKECLVAKEEYFVNITHQEWIRQIETNLELHETQNSREHFYLDEYLKTIKSHYKLKMDEPQMNKLVSALANYHDEVKEIQSKLNESIEFIENQVAEAFEELGYEKTGNWYVDREIKPHQLYFYVAPAQDIILNNRLWFYYEVRNKTNDLYRERIKTDELKAHFSNVVYDESKIAILGNDKRSNHSHIAKFGEDNFFTGTKSFKDKLLKILSSHFLSQNGIVEETVKFLNAKLAS